MPAKLIEFEGLDCSFKETNSKRLYEELTNRGFNCALYSFPNYNSESSIGVKKYLFEGFKYDLDQDQTNFIYAMDRFITYKDSMENDYYNKDFIILDRYVGSQYLYSTTKSDSTWYIYEGINNIKRLEFDFLKLPEPDITLYMRIPFDITQELIRLRGNKDKNESNMDYMKRVYDNSKFVCDIENWDIIECTEDGKVLTEEQIFNKIMNTLIDRGIINETDEL